MDTRFIRIVLLCHHRWALPVIDVLNRGQGAKFITLSKKLGASQNALKQTLDYLIHKGFVRRNEGYGHPMRPEYLLTQKGSSVGGPVSELIDKLNKVGVTDVGLMKWSLSVLFSIGCGSDRFSQIQRQLESITNRALAQTLKELEGAGLVRRQILEGYPPATCYDLSSEATPLIPLLAKL